MTEKLFKLVPISELPKEIGWYNVWHEDKLPQASGRQFFDGKIFTHSENGYRTPTHWFELLEPIGVQEAATGYVKLNKVPKDRQSEVKRDFEVGYSLGYQKGRAYTQPHAPEGREMDWEKIERDFKHWGLSGNIEASHREVFNWFKQHLQSLPPKEGEGVDEGDISENHNHASRPVF